jgi:hypothetical protein
MWTAIERRRKSGIRVEDDGSPRDPGTDPLGRESCSVAAEQVLQKVGSRKFALDSSLEGSGFELPVPREISSGFEASAESRN